MKKGNITVIGFGSIAVKHLKNYYYRSAIRSMESSNNFFYKIIKVFKLFLINLMKKK